MAILVWKWEDLSDVSTKKWFEIVQKRKNGNNRSHV